MNLSILCITKAEPHAFNFLEHMAEACDELGATFLVVADGQDAYDRVRHACITTGYQDMLESNGYLESIHDEALALCDEGYVLRLDDDEYIGPEFVAWLKGGFYTAEPLWKFARAHIWANPDGSECVIVNPPLWPDMQTRLGRKQYMGGRNFIHCGSPFGGGAEAPVYIEHHKFVAKSVAERRATLDNYDRILPGSGQSFEAFSLPELAFEHYELVSLGNGYTESIT